MLVTTPIFYINSKPHLGHAYTLIYAEFLKRWAKDQGANAILATGVDEHGKKVYMSALKEKMEIQKYCDKYADIFEGAIKSLDIDYDIF